MIDGPRKEQVLHPAAAKHGARSREAATQSKRNDGTEGVRYRISTGDAKSTWPRHDPPRSPSTCTQFCALVGSHLLLLPVLFEEAKVHLRVCLELISWTAFQDCRKSDVPSRACRSSAAVAPRGKMEGGSYCMRRTVARKR